jgi:multidrug transporter EmrE-like cation transporter
MVANIIYLAVFTVILAAGQVLFKKIGLTIAGLPFPSGLRVAVCDPLLYGALALYGLATMMWVGILSRVPLSQAYPWVALGTVVVPLLGWCVFGERLVPTFWVGMMLIVAGLVVLQYGQSS